MLNIALHLPLNRSEGAEQPLERGIICFPWAVFAKLGKAGLPLLCSFSISLGKSFFYPCFSCTEQMRVLVRGGCVLSCKKKKILSSGKTSNK